MRFLHARMSFQIATFQTLLCLASPRPCHQQRGTTSLWVLHAFFQIFFLDCCRQHVKLYRGISFQRLLTLLCLLVRLSIGSFFWGNRAFIHCWHKHARLFSPLQGFLRQNHSTLTLAICYCLNVQFVCAYLFCAKHLCLRHLMNSPEKLDVVKNASLHSFKEWHQSVFLVDLMFVFRSLYWPTPRHLSFFARQLKGDLWRAFVDWERTSPFYNVVICNLLSSSCSIFVVDAASPIVSSAFPTPASFSKIANFKLLFSFELSFKILHFSQSFVSLMMFPKRYLYFDCFLSISFNGVHCCAACIVICFYETTILICQQLTSFKRDSSWMILLIWHSFLSINVW